MRNPATIMPVPTEDKAYLDILLDPIETCREYDPKFGQGESVSLEEFQALYGADPFYSWLGLDNPLLYAAHKAGGGITSFYRQLGIGSERLFRKLLMDHLGLSAEEVRWSYTVTTGGGRSSTLELDGRIETEHVADEAKRGRVQAWMNSATSHLDVDPDVAAALKGAVFEVRQAYKSKDSKRQNADIENYLKAYTKGYLPVVLLMSNQIDSDVAARYEGAGCLLLRGLSSGSAVRSTYAFCSEVVGYDLAALFERNKEYMKQTVDAVIRALLSPDDEA